MNVQHFLKSCKRLELFRYTSVLFCTVLHKQLSVRIAQMSPEGLKYSASSSHEFIFEIMYFVARELGKSFREEEC